MANSNNKTKFNIRGNLCYIENGNLFTEPKYSNCLLIDCKTDNDTNGLNGFDSLIYITCQMRIFNDYEFNPSIIYFGNPGKEFADNILVNNYKKLDNLQNIDKINKTPSYFCPNSKQQFIDSINYLIQSRQNIDTNQLQAVFIIIDNAVNIELSLLNEFLTKCKNLKIFYLVAIKSSDDYKKIGLHFPLRLTFENNKLKRIIRIIDEKPYLIKEFGFNK